MTPIKWLVRALATLSGTGEDHSIAGTEPMVQDDIQVILTSRTQDMNPRFEVFCDGEALGKFSSEDIAIDIYENLSAVHKEIWEHQPDGLAFVIRKSSYGVECL